MGQQVRELARVGSGARSWRAGSGQGLPGGPGRGHNWAPGTEQYLGRPASRGPGDRVLGLGCGCVC